MPPQLAVLGEALADRYAVESELGRGGMATVYLAEDRKHDRKVAIKVLQPDLAASRGRRAVPARDRDRRAALRTRTSCRCIDSGEADGLLYYVSPYVPGGSLRDRLGREGRARRRGRGAHRAGGRRRRSTTRTATASCTAT